MRIAEINLSFIFRRVLVIALSVFGLSACGGYYTKDSYYGVMDNDNWHIVGDSSRYARFSCGEDAVWVALNRYEARRVAVAVFGFIPVWPVDEGPVSDGKMEISIGYQAKMHVCRAADLRVSIGKATQSALAASQSVRGDLVWCRYGFPEQVMKTRFDIAFSESNTTCPVPPLKLKAKSRLGFEGGPW